MRPLLLLTTAFLVLATGGAATADPVTTPTSTHPLISARPAVNRPVAPILITRGQTYSPRTPGIATTAVNHQFGASGPALDAGFICGRPDDPVVSGSAAARGYDPSGRFLGASLHIAFR